MKNILVYLFDFKKWYVPLIFIFYVISFVFFKYLVDLDFFISFDIDIKYQSIVIDEFEHIFDAYIMFSLISMVFTIIAYLSSKIFYTKSNWKYLLIILCVIFSIASFFVLGVGYLGALVTGKYGIEAIYMAPNNNVSREFIDDCYNVIDYVWLPSLFLTFSVLVSLVIYTFKSIK